MNIFKRLHHVLVCCAIICLALPINGADAIKPIPAGSKIYVAPEAGFDTFLAAALQKKKVPVTVVADKDKADFILESTSESQKAGWAKTIFLKQAGSDEEASVRLINPKTSEVIFAYSVNKRNSVHGKQSSAEACAKHLKDLVDAK